MALNSDTITDAASTITAANTALVLPDTLWSPSMEEQETVITFSRGDGRAQIYTSDNTVLTKIRKCMSSSDEYSLDRIIQIRPSENSPAVPSAVEVSCPVEFICFRKGRKELTDEQKEAARQRLAEARKKTALGSK